MAPKQPLHQTRSTSAADLGKFLAAYRGQLTHAEAARRAGLPEGRWAQVESGDGQSVDIPAHTVAAMCAAVGADIATGLELAGHDADAYSYLVTAPPGLMHLSPPRTPCIANYRAVGDVLASPGGDPRARIGRIYREAAAANRRLAEDLTQTPPEGRTDFWAGFAAALRALADEQLRIAEQETPTQ